MGYKCHIPCVKPLMTYRQRHKRLTWAKEKKNWTVAQWSKVLFSDESPKVVKSRYMQYDKPKNTKDAGAFNNYLLLCGSVSSTDAQQRARTDYVTAPSNLSVTARGRCRRSRTGARSRTRIRGHLGSGARAGREKNVANTTILSAGKSQEKSGSGTPTRKSVLPQKFKVPPATNTADGSLVFKDDLQSTLLDGHKIARPELDFSVINDKTLQKGTPKPLSASEQRKPKKEVTSVRVCIANEWKHY
ncbi:unnamed protein product [Ranitomeya imitator]|uniref:Transposase n=1 Tax=Ranitomeya imitator TaxID=111125 RepID=A0ABN9LUV5_9NEOB|nr:unnamed protein product [Ranitomeya imitator]